VFHLRLTQFLSALNKHTDIAVVHGVPNMFGKEKGSQKQKMLLFDVPDSVIRNLRELENLTTNLFERQVKQMTLDLFKEE
jgi:hypothetical protein